MHVPDGFLDLATSTVTAAVAVGAVALSLRGARRELDERTTPLAGLVVPGPEQLRGLAGRAAGHLKHQ